MCAIVGVFGNDNASSIVCMSLFAMQHRGHESSGISSSGMFDGEIQEIKTIKNTGFVRDVFNDENIKTLQGDIAIGHNRYATVSGSNSRNIQPISVNCKLGDISIAHNGNLTNKDEVRAKLIEDGAIFTSDMDSENLIHLIAKSTKDTIKDRIIDALADIKGAYNFVIQSKDKMFVIRDKHAIRPLSIGKLKSGGYIVASETCCFDLINASFVRDVNAGEMLIFDKQSSDNGFDSVQLFDPEPRPCAFEYIYFARPDSNIDGKNVYKTRIKLGKALAKSDEEFLKDNKIDMVIAVPDSGIPSALGYAKASNLPYEAAIIRNHYVGRTFIEPTQDIRDLKVKMKLSPLKYLLEGKNIVVVDDSIVRGTTSKQIVSMLKNAGVAKIHFRVSSPIIKYPDIYGINTPTKEELIGSNKSVDEINDYIGSNSLNFLSIDDLCKCIDIDAHCSLVSFDGKYFA